MSARAKKWTGGGEEGLLFFCPGCQEPHSVKLTGPGAWKWNGSLDAPTLSPSVLVTQPPTEYRCHSFVRDGRVEFLADCSHALAGQTVEVPEWD